MGVKVKAIEFIENIFYFVLHICFLYKYVWFGNSFGILKELQVGSFLCWLMLLIRYESEFWRFKLSNLSQFIGY